MKRDAEQGRKRKSYTNEKKKNTFDPTKRVYVRGGSAMRKFLHHVREELA